MNNAHIENCKKSAAKVVAAWGKELEKIAAALADQKKQREAAEAYLASTCHDLTAILQSVQVPEEVCATDFPKISAYVDELIKRKAAVLGKNVSIGVGTDISASSRKLLLTTTTYWKP